MYKFLFLTLTLLTLHFALLTNLSAHILATDGSIGAVLHIDPEDDPIAGESATLYFEFKDKNGQFKPEDCTCITLILENGKEVARQNLVNNSISYAFPQKDVYQVKVTGLPDGNGSFQPFTLSYDIRVARESVAQPNNTAVSQQTSVLPAVIIGSILSALGVIFTIRQGRRKRQETK